MDVGIAAEVSPTEFSFVDSVLDGTYSYVAELRYEQTVVRSAPYVVEVTTNEPPPVSQFFSSVLYGYLHDEHLRVLGVDALGGQIVNPVTDLMALTVPSIQSGTLTSTISFKQASSSIDALALTAPDIVDGTLTDTISFKQGSSSIDGLQIGQVPSITSGSMVVVISYVQYQAPPDSLGLSTPTISSGTLA